MHHLTGNQEKQHFRNVHREFHTLRRIYRLLDLASRLRASRVGGQLADALIRHVLDQLARQARRVGNARLS